MHRMGRFRMTGICSIQLWMSGTVLEIFHTKAVGRMNEPLRSKEEKRRGRKKKANWNGREMEKIKAKKKEIWTNRNAENDMCSIASVYKGISMAFEKKRCIKSFCASWKKSAVYIGCLFNEIENFYGYIFRLVCVFIVVSLAICCCRFSLGFRLDLRRIFQSFLSSFFNRLLSIASGRLAFWIGRRTLCKVYICI